MAANKEIISSMTAADIKNELEANGLSTVGTKNELVQRLYSFRKGKHTPTIAPSFSFHSTPTELNAEVRELMEKVNEREKEIDERISLQFEKLSKQLMLFVGSHVQNEQNPPEFEDSSERREEKIIVTDIVKLNRKLKMFGRSIEMIFAEIEHLEKSPKVRLEMESALRRLNSLEDSYGNTVQEIIASMKDEIAVDEEIQKWSSFQQEIIRISRKAENYISLQNTEESQLAHVSQVVEDMAHKSCHSGTSYLRLPKFTLPEFSGDILEWVPWWDQFKTCIHENEALGDRERFNYLRMYVTGTAKRAIEYIEVSSENYLRAIEALQRRYGRKRIVVEHLVESILSIEKKDKVNAKSLRYLYDVMVNRYHTLESYEPSLKYCHRIIVPILQSKLPQEVRRKWEYELSKIENEEEDKKITVEYFFDFLRSHVMSEEASEKSRSAFQDREKEERKNLRTRWTGRTFTDKDILPSSGTSLAGNSKQENYKVQRNQSSVCIFCGKSHDSSNCYMVQKKTVEERLQIIKEKKLCFNCLRPTGPSHTSATCKRPGCLIEGCNKKHHVLLHRAQRVSDEQKAATATGDSQDSSSNQVKGQSGLLTGVIGADVNKQIIRLLPTALVRLHCNGKELIVRVLVDSGSDHSYIRREVAQALNLPSNGPPKSMTISMHGGQTRKTKVENVDFLVSPVHDCKKRIKLSAWSVHTVCSPLEPVQVDMSKYRHLEDLDFADKYPRGKVEVDLLIGADQWDQVMLNGIRKGPSYTPFAMNSIFGWLLLGCSGKATEQDSQNHRSATNLNTVVRIGEDEEHEANLFSLKKFWELESIGIVDQKKELSSEEDEALQKFQSSIHFEGNRYEVRLPWKSNAPELFPNYQQALKRLTRVEEMMRQDERKQTMYKEAVHQYLRDGHAREIKKEDQQASKIYYLPHHPVFREDKTTTKCRVVFDASARNGQEISLNDCLLPGPALHPNLVSILLRFRLHRIAMMADIRKMFLQVKLALEDQNVHRFLWRDDKHESPKTYCMTRVTFGVVSSPFEAIATVQYHAKTSEDKFPTAAREVVKNMYVDDYLSGEEDVDKAYILHKELHDMMKSGGFELVKWYTNSEELKNRISPELRGPTTLVELKNEAEPLKALGISWDTNNDIFLFNQGQKLIEVEDQRTKRSLISIASKLFDPLGFLSP